MSDTPAVASVPVAVAAVAELDVVLERLLAADLTGLSDEQSARLVEAVEVGARKLSSVGLSALADVDRRRAYAKAGYVSTYGFVKGQLRLGDRAVKHRIAAMKNLTDRLTPSGDVLDPVCPATAASLRGGVIDLEYVHTILATMDGIPSAVSAEEGASAEKTMAGFAADYTPKRLEQLGERLLAHLNPDGSLSDAADRARTRSVSRPVRGKDLMGRSPGASIRSPTRCLMCCSCERKGGPRAMQ